MIGDLHRLALLLSRPADLLPSLDAIATALLAPTGPADDPDHAILLHAMLRHCLVKALEQSDTERTFMASREGVDMARDAPLIGELNRRGLLRGAVPICLLPPVSCPVCGLATDAADMPDPAAPCPGCRR